MDVNDLIKPVLSCMEDKSGEIRTQACAVMEAIVKAVGIGAVKRQCKDLKPASMYAASYTRRWGGGHTHT